jgi:hypothetical protein
MIALPNFCSKRALLLFTTFSFFLAAPARGGDDDYLPDRTFIVGSVNLPEMRKSRTYQEGKNQAKFLVDAIEKGLSEYMGIPAANIARFTLGVGVGERRGIEDLKVITTIKPITAAQIKEAKKPAPDYRNFTHKESKVNGFTVFEENYSFAFEPKDSGESEPRVFSGQAFYLVEEKTVLFGRIDTLKIVLGRKEKPALSANMKAGLKAGAADTWTLVIDLQAMPERPKKSLLSDLDRIAGLTDVFGSVQTLSLRGSSADKIKAFATVACKDAASAAEAKKVADGGLVFLKGELKGDPNLPPTVQAALKELRNLLDGVKLSTNDAQVRAEVVIEARAAIAIVQLLDIEKTSKRKFDKDSKDEKK